MYVGWISSFLFLCALEKKQSRSTHATVLVENVREKKEKKKDKSKEKEKKAKEKQKEKEREEKEREKEEKAREKKDKKDKKEKKKKAESEEEAPKDAAKGKAPKSATASALKSMQKPTVCTFTFMFRSIDAHERHPFLFYFFEMSKVRIALLLHCFRPVVIFWEHLFLALPSCVFFFSFSSQSIFERLCVLGWGKCVSETHPS